ncbi:hypothetical protein XF_2368 [Xylella fastidiosa 9a5c]|uniref:Uncharacterized protein n=1 Tax=Xylella fastidiosa (strain 9a5c) TaxID=160492 RepID=Q9PAX7_XYLFA|nr:hypothetical protein XF_2368 [Xylella fastidiosa 9a5c]
MIELLTYPGQRILWEEQARTTRQRWFRSPAFATMHQSLTNAGTLLKRNLTTKHQN